MEIDEPQVTPPEPTEEEEIVLDLEELQPTTPEKDWKSEALKYKAIAQRYANKKKEGGTPAPKQALAPQNDDLRSTVQELKLAEQKRQFGYANSLSPEETDAVFKLNSNPTKETLNDDFVKGGLQAIRSKKKVEDNTPRSSRSSGFKLPQKEAITAEDKQEAFEKWKKDRMSD